VAIPAAVLARVYEHARAAFPAECCGYLVGDAGSAAVDAAVPCRNAAPRGLAPGPDAGYAIAGAELFELARSLRGPRPARVIYHSHPNARAYFSALDQELAAGPAYPVQHLVIGVGAAGVTEAAVFGWCAARGAYVELARWPAGSAEAA
jgi:proteasome lid subunit RPN8/RPN11